MTNDRPPHVCKCVCICAVSGSVWSPESGSGEFDITCSTQGRLSVHLILCVVSTQSVKNCSFVSHVPRLGTSDLMVD